FKLSECDRRPNSGAQRTRGVLLSSISPAGVRRVGDVCGVDEPIRKRPDDPFTDPTDVELRSPAGRALPVFKFTGLVFFSGIMYHFP
ncbi:MAG: hypothetical protein RL189_2815, partial [Pseudomonadota bacterium]